MRGKRKLINDFFFSIEKRKLRIKEPTCKSRENFDIFLSRFLQPKVNDPLFSYYFKTLK